MGSTRTEIFQDYKAAYYTLGCKLNFSETSTVGNILKEQGVRQAEEGEIPDICIVNTCSVTEMAEKKSRSLIRKLHRNYPEANIIVTGCYAQLKPEEVAGIDGVDMVFGTNDKLRIGKYVESWISGKKWGENPGEKIQKSDFGKISEFIPSCSRGDRTRYFLKVQDGCDYFCTYCTIPFARGRSRSGKISDLVEQARQVAKEGGKEIVITGVNIGDFGKNTGERFFDLIKELDKVEGIERFRISSIEPNLLTDEIIEWVGTESKRFMPHFHIPLQSGSDSVLKIMNRRYDTALFAHRIEKIRDLIPEAFIGVDIISGARGETKEEWIKTLEFVEGLDISRFHVFPYSERPGTAALLLGGSVDKRERDRRAETLIKISGEKLNRFMDTVSGTERPVLWEHGITGTDLMSGLTDNYIRVIARMDETLLNRVSFVKLTGKDPERAETMLGDHIKAKR